MMKKQSFSNTVKEHLAANAIKKKCCRHAFSDGCDIYSGDMSPTDLVKKGYSGLVCAECLSHFVAGIFMSSGNISDPSKSYHMEFSFSEESTADAVSHVLIDAGFEPKKGTRKGRFLLYFKNSMVIEDLLGYIGASYGAFEIINAKIVKELRVNTNRQVNCDSANISKTIGAAEQYIHIINHLIELDKYDSMTDELKKTADLRITYPDASMSELGQHFVPPISKSGVKHRLDKIKEFYDSLKKNDTKAEV